MNPYLFWLLVAAMVAFLQMFNKIVQYKTSEKYWKQTAFIATEKYNELLVKQSIDRSIKVLDMKTKSLKNIKI